MKKSIKIILLTLLICWTSAFTPVGQPTPIQEIYRLSEVYHKDLFQPYTWVFLDIDETLIAQDKPLDRDFVNIVKNYSDRDSFTNPAATKFFILTDRPDLKSAKSGVRQAGLNPDTNISGFLLSPGNSNKGEKLKEFLREQFQAGKKPRHIVFADNLLSEIVSVKTAFQEMQESEPHLVKGVQLHLFQLIARQPGEQVKQAAGVFLYMKCPYPDQSDEYCAVLIDRNYGKNKDAFSNPGSLVDPGESPAQAAARETTEELGGHIMLRPDGLHTDYRNPKAILKLVGKNVSDANFGKVEYHMYFKEIPQASAQDILEKIKGYKGHGANESNAVAIVPLSDLSKLEQQMTIQTNNGLTYAHRNGDQAETVEIKLYPQMLQLLNQLITTKNGPMTWYELFINHLDRRVGLMTAEHEQTFAQTIARKAQLAGEIKAHAYNLKSRTINIENESINATADLSRKRKRDDNNTEQIQKRVRLEVKDSSEMETEEQHNDLLYTASDAYLKVMMGNNSQDLEQSPKALIDTFFDKPYTSFGNLESFTQKTFREQIVRAFQNEREKKEWFAFYHGTDAKVAFLNDILSAYRARFKAVQAQSNPKLRFLDRPFMGFESVSDLKAFFKTESYQPKFAQNYLRDFENKEFKEGAIGKRSYQDLALSANISLFGSDGNDTSSTLLNFARGLSRKPPNYKELFTAIRNEIGFDKTWEDFQPLFDKYNRNRGRLYQLFINPKYVDRIGYMSFAGGPSLKLDTSRSDALKEPLIHLRSDPIDFMSKLSSEKRKLNLREIQARLFLKPEWISDPNIFQIYVYDNSPYDQKSEREFWIELNKMVTDDVAKWILKKEKMLTGTISEGQLSLKKLADQAYKETAGLPYVQRDRVQEIARSFKEILDTGDVQKIKDFIDRNPKDYINIPINNTDYYNPARSYKLNPLFYTYHFVQKNKAQIIEVLLNAKASVNATNTTKQTLLNLAIKNGQKDVIDVLIKNKDLDFDHKDSKGNSYIDYARSAYNFDLIQFLIMQKELSTIQSMIQNKEDLNIQDRDGNTFLHRMIMKSKEFSGPVNLLVENGARIDIQNNQGKYPLQLALESGKIEFSENLIISIKATANYKQFMGNTLKIDLPHDQAQKNERVNKINNFLASFDLMETVTHLIFDLGTKPIINQMCRKFPNLKGLTIQINNMRTGSIVDIVKANPSLTYLDISNNSLLENDIIQITAALKDLEELFLEGTKISAASLSAISKLNKLRTLDISSTSIRDGLENLSNLANLRNLEISNNNIGLDGALAIGKLTNLTRLNISYNEIGPDGAKAISTLSNLTWLNLEHSKIQDTGAEEIRNLKNLVWLNLKNNKITSQGAKSIATLENLETVDMSHNPLDYTGALLIASLPKLTRFDFIGTRISTEENNHLLEIINSRLPNFISDRQ